MDDILEFLKWAFGGPRSVINVTWPLVIPTWTLDTHHWEQIIDTGVITHPRNIKQETTYTDLWCNFEKWHRIPPILLLNDLDDARAKLKDPWSYLDHNTFSGASGPENQFEDEDVKQAQQFPKGDATTMKDWKQLMSGQIVSILLGQLASGALGDTDSLISALFYEYRKALNAKPSDKLGAMKAALKVLFKAAGSMQPDDLDFSDDMLKLLQDALDVDPSNFDINTLLGKITSQTIKDEDKLQYDWINYDLVRNGYPPGFLPCFQQTDIGDGARDRFNNLKSKVEGPVPCPPCVPEPAQDGTRTTPCDTSQTNFKGCTGLEQSMLDSLCSTLNDKVQSGLFQGLANCSPNLKNLIDCFYNQQKWIGKTIVCGPIPKSIDPNQTELATTDGSTIYIDSAKVKAYMTDHGLNPSNQQQYKKALQEILFHEFCHMCGGYDRVKGELDCQILERILFDDPGDSLRVSENFAPLNTPKAIDYWLQGSFDNMGRDTQGRESDPCDLTKEGAPIDGVFYGQDFIYDKNTGKVFCRDSHGHRGKCLLISGNL